MSKTANNTDKTPSINEQITDLNQKIAWFYSDDFSLDSALSNYKEAVDLANNIKNDLNTLKNEVTLISKNFTN